MKSFKNKKVDIKEIESLDDVILTEEKPKSKGIITNLSNEKKDIDISMLNDEQADAYNKIIFFFEQGKNYYSLLEGPAGSGKTFLTAKIMDFIINNGLFGKIAVACPTWKAVKVAKQMCPKEKRENIDFTSLHSLLGLKHRVTADGKEVYEKDPKTICKLSFYDFVIVDEASMISDQLFEELDKNIATTKVLFVGDSNQINPVNHSHSIPMIKEKREYYKIDHYLLTKIVRQAEGNPIISLSQDILHDRFDFSKLKTNLVDKTGVVMLNGHKDALRQLLEALFCGEDFDKNANYAKVVAWTNAMVSSFNNLIRKMKYGKAPKIVKGEKLMAERPIRDDNEQIIITTNEDLEVLEISESQLTIDHGVYDIYKCLVRGDEEKEFEIPIIHERSDYQLERKLQELSRSAIREGDFKKKIKIWREYYRLRDTFAAVKYNYALTCHSSQGSTFNNCIMVYSDISRNNNEEERKRILYTAATRPKEILYIL